MKSGTLGAYLKLLRERKGYTLREVSEKCGISLRSYLRYEVGEALPKPKILDKLAEVLSVNEGEIEELKTRLNLLRDQEISRRVGVSNEQVLTFVPSEYLRTDKEMLPVLAEYILADMKKKGITSDTLAEETGIDKVKLKSILLGEEAPDVDEIKAIARVLGVPASRYLSLVLEVNDQTMIFFARSKEVRELLSSLYSLDEVERRQIVDMFLTFIKTYFQKKESNV